MINSVEDMLHDADMRAYIDACETTSPNSPEFAGLYERLSETYVEPIGRYQDLREEGYPHHEAMVKAGLADPDY